MIHKNITINNRAILTTYLLNDTDELRVVSRPAVLVFPGGGYSMVSDREGEQVALAFNNAGFHAFVFTYTVRKGFKEAYKDAEECIRYVNAHRKEFHINGLATCGFSAGAHLSCAIATLCPSKPDGMILVYPPLIQEEWQNMCPDAIDLLDKIDEKTPKAFIVHAFDDPLVPVHNSYRLMKALDEHHIPFEAHIYPSGGHGFSLASIAVGGGEASYENDAKANWISSAVRWVGDYIGKIEFAPKEVLSEKDIPDIFKGILLEDAAKDKEIHQVIEDFNPGFATESILKQFGKIPFGILLIKAGVSKKVIQNLAKATEELKSKKK